MKVIIILLCAIAYSKSVRISYNSGTLIREGKIINGAYTKLKILVKVPTLQNITLQRFKQPCDYTHQLIEDLNLYNITNPTYTDVLQSFNGVCRRNARLRKSSLALRRSYQQHIIQIEESMEDLLPQNNRTKKSLFSSIRHGLGIADYDQQKDLKKKVQSISENLFHQQGQLVGLYYAMEHVSEKMKKLYESAETLTKVSNRLSNHLDFLTSAMNGRTILEKYKEFLNSETLQIGIVQNQFLARYSHVIEQRQHALSILARGYLPPQLISPKELNNIIYQVEAELSSEHPRMTITHDSVYEYYALRNIVSFIKHNNVFIKIPVIISMFDQNFRLYELVSFPMPVQKLESQAMIVRHEQMIAINEITKTYFSVRKIDLQRCMGSDVLTCNKLFTQRIMENSNSCELSIYRENVDEIKQFCDLGLIDKAELNTQFHYITNNRILAINPLNSNIYKMCKSDQKQIYLSNEFVFEIELECFCYVITERAISPIFADENCINETVIDVHHASENILFMSLMLNESITDLSEHNISNLIPLLELPEIPNNFHLEDNVLDLKRIMYERSSAYKNMILNRLDTHGSALSNFSVVKVFAYGMPILATAIVIIAVVFFAKTKNMSKLLTMATLFKSSRAAPVNYTVPEILDITTESIVLLIVILTLCYIILKYFRLFQKLQKYITLPCNSCLSLSEEIAPKIEILFHIENIKDYCMIYVDSLNYSHISKIKIAAEETVTFTFHSGCLTNYLTINKEIKLHLNNENQDIYRLPNALPIPCYLKNKVADILRDNYTARILVGSGGIYESHDIKLE